MPSPSLPDESQAVSARVPRVAILCGALWLQACKTDRAADFVVHERANIVAWTLPPGATMTAETELAPTGGGVAATWNVSTAMTWSEYKSRIASRTGTGYRQIPADESRLSYARQLPGDALIVDVAVVSIGPPLKVSVSFSARPD